MIDQMKMNILFKSGASVQVDVNGVPTVSLDADAPYRVLAWKNLAGMSDCLVALDIEAVDAVWVSK